MRLLFLSMAVLALAGCSKSHQQPASDQAAEATDAGPRTGVDRGHKGKPASDVVFKDPHGEDITLAEFRGRPLLLNLWATWCRPCITELPTLQKVAERETDLQVIPVSQDSADQSSVEAFLEYQKLDFAAYQDPNMALAASVGPNPVLPTTILYDSNGREVWRYVGDLDWTGPEATKLLAEMPGGTG